MHEGLLIAGNALALVASWASARAWFPARYPEERFLAVVAGWAVFVLPPLTLLGLVGHLHYGAALPLIGLLAVVSLGVARGHKPIQLESGAGMTEDAGPPPAGVGAIAGIMVALMVPVIDRLALEPWIPHWDDFSYHGPMAAHWLEERRFVLAPFNYHAYYPGNAELLSAWFMMPSRHDAYATLTGLYGMTLAAASVAALARFLGATTAGALASAAMILAAKPFLHQASAFAAVDLVGAAFAGASLVIAVGAQRGAQPGHTLARVIYTACFAGLATGAKITFAPAGVVAFVALVACARPTLRRAAMLGLVYFAAALACGGYFYIRNFALTGNPLYPADIAFFEGPLTAEIRETTTLLYQMQHVVNEATFNEALKKLLDWPTALGVLILAGYACSILALLRPSLRRSPYALGVLTVVVAGFIFFVVAITGPFSGTANDRYASLQIRLRFFLGFALLGPPLLAAALDREVRLRRYGSYGLALVAALALAREAPLVVVALATIGAVCGHYGSRGLSRLRAAQGALALVACVAVPALIVMAVSLVKLDQQYPAMRKQTGAWNVLEALPDGARLTWFSTFERYKYYRAFGERLRLVPVPVEEDGRPYTFLHQALREALPPLAPGEPNPRPYAWRHQSKRPRSWDEPLKRSFELDKLVDNLLAQRIEYVFVMKRHKGEWPKQLAVLEQSSRATRIAKARSYVLFRIKKE